MLSLLYVSRSRMAANAADPGIESILAASHRNNGARGVTGALIFTGTHFAQVIEGRRDDVQALIEVIRADPRHGEVTVMSEQPIAQRDFGGWSMAYCGTVGYVQRQVDWLLAEADKPSQAAVAAMRRLMLELARAGGIRRPLAQAG